MHLWARADNSHKPRRLSPRGVDCRNAGRAVGHV
jgi:hypothetical protein